MTTDSIPTHTFCINCGYCLAGLPEEGACPECATPCSDTLACLEFTKNNADALRKVSSGLRTTLFGYAFLVTGVGLFLSGRFMPGSLHLFIFCAGLLTLCAAAISLPVGLSKIGEFHTTHNGSRQTRLYSIMSHTGILGYLFTFIIVLPLAMLLDWPLLVSVFYHGLSFSITLIFFGTANFSIYIAVRAGIKNLRSKATIACCVACPIALILVTSSIAQDLAFRSFSGALFGINGGQWHDIYIIAVAAILLLHAVFVFYFYRKLKARLNTLPPPASPTAS